MSYCLICSRSGASWLIRARIRRDLVRVMQAEPVVHGAARQSCRRGGMTRAPLTGRETGSAMGSLAVRGEQTMAQS